MSEVSPITTHLFDINDAKKYGVPEAAIFYNLKFWISKNFSNEKHFYDGQVWTYNSVSSFCKLFPYLTKKQIIKCLANLEKKGAIITGNYNQNSYDRTKWYAIKDFHLTLKKEFAQNAIFPNGQIDMPKEETKENSAQNAIFPNRQIDVTKKGNPFSRTGISYNTTDDKPDDNTNSIPPIMSPGRGETEENFEIGEEIPPITPLPHLTPKESFETFWSIYPRRIGKELAYKQFLTVLRKNHKVDAILNNTKLYSDHCLRHNLDQRYIKTPVAFLKETWNDEGSLKEWSSTHSKKEDGNGKIPHSQMPSDAQTRLRKLISEKKLSDEYGNFLTERSGIIEEFLRSGFWNGLPAFIQKAIVEFHPIEESKPKGVPEPSEWREFLEQNYDTENEKVQIYLLKGWKSIPEWLQKDIVFEMMGPKR